MYKEAGEKNTFLRVTKFFPPKLFPQNFGIFPAIGQKTVNYPFTCKHKLSLLA